MSLFNSQTIFSILITLLIGVGLYYYVKYKFRILELTQREQAKVLQSVIIAMNNNSQHMTNTFQNKSQEEIISDAVSHDTNRFRQVNSNSELIDVSDDSESDSDSDSESGSESDSESECDGEHGEEHIEEHEVNDNTTRKILFTGNNESHIVEHLDGPDVKVIELTNPLYPKNSSEGYNNKDNGEDESEEEDEDDDVEDDDVEDSDSESLSSDLDGPHESSGGHENHENHEICEIKGNVDMTEVNNQIIELETDNISDVISVDNSLDNISVKTVFKTKDSETHSEYSSMNVQSLRQLLKNKMSSEGAHMSEASINKLTKKDLIKHLS